MASVDDETWTHISAQEFQTSPANDEMSQPESSSQPPYKTARERYAPLTKEECQSLFDSDGRLVKENKLRKALFEGGVDQSWRAHIWKYIFNIYPYNSTEREQKTIDLENRAHYKSLHERWVVLDKTVNLPDEEPSSDPLEYLLSSDNEDEEQGHKSNVYSFAEQITNIDTRIDKTTVQECKGQQLPDHLSKETCPYCNVSLKRTDSSSVCFDEESLALLQILDFPSRVYATRQPVDLKVSYPKSKRIILRDVKRTDRSVHYFSHKRNLRKVHRLLHIYAVYHPDIGYCQGMNDILSRFLVVTDSEVDSYWMFCNYMEYKRADFLEDSMMNKIAFVQSLLQEMDEELHRFFEISECNDYLFCHRWLLLDFKREFSFSDSLRLLEVIASRYMTISSDNTLKELQKLAAEEFAAEGGEVRPAKFGLNQQYSFDVFICVAILLINKSSVSAERDAASIYGCLNGLALKMDINTVLSKAEELFFNYCRQSVSSGFKEIDI